MNAIRQFVMLVIAVTVLGLAACNNAAVTPTSTPVVNPTPDPTPNPTPDPTPDPNPDPTPTPDTTAPTMVSSQPENNSSGVSINSDILVNFSEAMNPNSLTVSINPSVNLGAATFKAENNSVQFNPPADLSGDTTYTVTVSGKDVAGNALTGSSSFAFKTATTADTTAPATPQNLSAEAGEGQVKLTWNANTEADLKGYTVHYGTDAGNLSSNVFIAKPSSSKVITALTNGTKYFFAINAEDGAGNKSGRSSTVNTAPKDMTAPKLLSSTPKNGAVNVLQNIAVVLSFNETINVAGSTFGKDCSSAQSNCFLSLQETWSNENKTLTLTNLIPGGLTNGATYRVFINAYDLAGNLLSKIYSFTIVPDLTAPSIVSSSPANGTIGLPINAQFVVNFSEPMDRTSVTNAVKLNLGLFGAGATLRGTYTFSNNDKTVIFTPNPALPYGEFMVLEVGIGAKDIAGNALGAGTASGYRVLQQITVDMPYYGSGHVLRSTALNGGLLDDTAYTGEGVIRVGDRALGAGVRPVQYSRGYLAFKINSIPRNATVIAARLQVFYKGSSGNPFGTLGNLILERVNPDQTIERAYVLSGNRGDFNLPALPCATCPQSIPSVTVDQNVLDYVRADRDGGGAASQFRLRFTTEYGNTNTGDYLDFFQNPILTVTYQYP